MSWLRAPNFAPKIDPEKITKNVCRVIGTYGRGIFIKEPTAVNAAKRLAKI